MKQFTKGFLMFMLTLGAILALGSKLEAQTKIDSNLLPAKKKEVKDDIKVKVLVLLNNEYLESDDIIIELVNMTEKTNNTSIITSDFTMFLKRNNHYLINITKSGYNKRGILINTTCPDYEDWTINLTLRLTSGGKNDIAGVLYYDEKTLSFETKPYPITKK